jgi:hypothetical protein
MTSLPPTPPSVPALSVDDLFLIDVVDHLATSYVVSHKIARMLGGKYRQTVYLARINGLDVAETSGLIAAAESLRMSARIDVD